MRHRRGVDVGGGACKRIPAHPYVGSKEELRGRRAGEDVNTPGECHSPVDTFKAGLLHECTHGAWLVDEGSETISAQAPQEVLNGKPEAYVPSVTGIREREQPARMVGGGNE